MDGNYTVNVQSYSQRMRLHGRKLYCQCTGLPTKDGRKLYCQCTELFTKDETLFICRGLVILLLYGFSIKICILQM